MKRFIVMFVPESNEELKEDFKKITEDYLKTADCENCDKKYNCPILSLDINPASLGIGDTNDFEDMKDRLQEIQKKENPSTMIVIDKEEDVCYVYKAAGTINEIKKNILPQLLEYYEIVCEQFMFFGTIADVRHLMVDPILN